RAVFFSSSGSPRYLHPFPTRRSSDLLGGPESLHPDDLLLAHAARDQLAARRVGALARELPVRVAAGPVRIQRGIGVPRQRDAVLDRKSTRLNSSHVKISYAVFCLKKK